MTSATIKPDSGAGGRHAEGRGFGLIVFALILLLVDGFFNMLYGIAAIANSHVFGQGAGQSGGKLPDHCSSRGTCGPGAGCLA